MADISEEEIAEEVVEKSEIEEMGDIFDQANAEETAPEAAEDAPKEPVEAKAEEIHAEPVAEAEGVEPDAVIAATPAIDAPASWSAVAKEAWPSIDPKLQEEILKRETDWQRQDGERATKLRDYEPIDRALDPVRQQLALNGISPGQYVTQLAAADQMLKQDPVAGIRYVAQHYGIDLQQLTQAEVPMDPALAPVMSQISQMQAALNSMAQNQQQQEQAQMLAEQEHVSSVIDDFMANPENTYASRLGEQIIAEIHTVNMLMPNASHEERLRAAYDRAVRLDDVAQAEIAAARATNEADTAAEEARKRAASATRIAATNLSNRGTAPGQTAPQYASEVDEISAIYDKVQAAG